MSRGCVRASAEPVSMPPSNGTDASATASPSMPTRPTSAVSPRSGRGRGRCSPTGARTVQPSCWPKRGPLWRGDPELPDTTAAAALLAGWRREHRQLVTEHLECVTTGSDPGSGLGELAELTATDPLDESLWVNYVRALRRTGRQTEALRAVVTARGALAGVGLEPGAALPRARPRSSTSTRCRHCRALARRMALAQRVAPARSTDRRSRSSTRKASTGTPRSCGSPAADPISWCSTRP